MLVRNLGTIIRITIMAMHRSGHDNFSRRAVAGELVRDYLSGRATLPLHQFPEKTLCSLFILTLLHQDIKNIAVLIYSSP